ncbi:replicative DNA helicase [Nakamurella lactea]|uniref:replicative DNA helicase n=1 Tax=Nakamurella lactea TaxID=459515 RepID=UPI00048B3ED0
MTAGAALQEQQYESEPRASRFDRQPPQDLAAEQSVIGGMLLSKDAIADVVETLRTGDFYKPAHALIFDAILDLYAKGEPADPITVSAELDRVGSIGRVGGATYLHHLTSTVPTAANAGYYARIVAEKAILRRLVEAGTTIVQLGYGGAEGEVGGGEVDQIVDRAQAEIYEVTERRTAEDYVILDDLLQPTLDEIDAIANNGGMSSGIPTGYADLDALTNGLHPGQMVIIAGRPGMGKSTVAMDMARNAAIKHKMSTVVFSLEMSKTDLTMRLLSAEAEIKLSQMRGGSMTDRDWQKIVRRMGEISDAPLYIDDSPNMTIMEIRAKARRLKQRTDLKLIVVDYLQLMTSGKKVESRQQEVSEFSRQMKLLAKELEVPVVALSQLNRGPEQRTDKRPMLSDLRESGSLEQDADLVILVHRPDAWDAEDPRAGEADLIVAKHRNGETRTIPVAHQLHYSRFTDLAAGM